MTNYKKIAEIIKGCLYRLDLKDLNAMHYDGPEIIMIKLLADYFEQESSKNHPSCCCEVNKYELEQLFDRKQFLKDCGVE